MGTISGSCMSDRGDIYVGGRDWPTLVPNLVNGRVYSATRMVTAPSSFGDFGGTWVTKADAGMGGTCTITVNGTAFHSDCTVWGIYGKTDLTVSDDCILSGKNPSGHGDQRPTPLVCISQMMRTYAACTPCHHNLARFARNR